MAQVIDSDVVFDGKVGHNGYHTNIADMEGLICQALAQIAGTVSLSNGVNIAAIQSFVANGAAVPGITDWINVKAPAYGATGNAIRHDDGGITATQTVFTSASATFTAADIGKLIFIRGAGPTAGGVGSVLVTTINGFTNSTTVTVAAAASNTVSGALYYYGTDDSAAFQAAISAAALFGSNDGHAYTGSSQAIYVPFAKYMIGTSLKPPSGKAFRLYGGGALLVGAGVDLFDFGAGVTEATIEIANLQMDVAGGHIFANPNIHGLMYLHDLVLTQRSVNKCILYQDDVANSTNTSLYAAKFERILYWQDSGTRSIEMWHIIVANGADLTDVTFEKIIGPNPPGAGPSSLDNTQYQFLISSNDASGHMTNIAWRNCLAASCYGGYINAQGAKNLSLDGLNFYNTNGATMSNDLITFGANAQSLPCRSIAVRNVSRNNGLGSGGGNPPPYDLSFASTCEGVTVENFTAQATTDGPYINVGSCLQALLMGNRTHSSNLVINNQNSSAGQATIVIGAGQITIGGTAITVP